jgi:hypothetical protein
MCFFEDVAEDFVEDDWHHFPLDCSFPKIQFNSSFARILSVEQPAGHTCFVPSRCSSRFM